jgi:hypothetical protein
LNPDTVDLYFQGLASFNQGITLEFMAQARGSFERALALDPNNLDACSASGESTLTWAHPFCPTIDPRG